MDSEQLGGFIGRRMGAAHQKWFREDGKQQVTTGEIS